MVTDSSAPAAESSPEAPLPGTVTTFRWRKWDGGAHWIHECIYLGSDGWGEWFGQPVGWHSARPGRDVVTGSPSVMLMSRDGDFALTVNEPPARTRIYIDLGWDIRWSTQTPGAASGIDMDLDVVKTVDERGIWIDDRDEWEEHRVRYGYPEQIVTHLEARALELEAQVTRQAPPFDDATPGRWLARLAELAPPRLDG